MSELALDENRLARIQETFSRVAYAHFLGLKLGEVKTGEATIHLEVRDELKQNQGVIHGGVVASIIDTASAFAVATRLEPGERVTTTDLTIHYLRPIAEGELTTRAQIIRAGRRLFVVSVDVCSDKQVLLATAVTGYLKLQ